MICCPTKHQLNLMQKEKDRLLTLIDTLEKTIASTERKMTMTTEEKFKGFTFKDNEKYKQAATEKYGETVMNEAEAKQKGKEEIVADGFNKIFFAFAENIEKGLPATAAENVDLAKQLHQHMCAYAFDCSIDVFSSIGFGYAQNEEFRTNLDKYGKGVGQYACDAIQAYVAQERKIRQKRSKDILLLLLYFISQILIFLALRVPHHKQIHLQLKASKLFHVRYLFSHRKTNQ